MEPEPHANLIAGEWRPAARGARFARPSSVPRESWPQSGSEDVTEARRAARVASAAWGRVPSAEREEHLRAFARVLEQDSLVSECLCRRFGLRPEEAAPHAAGLAAELDAAGETAAHGAGGGIAWCAPDWSELVRKPLLDVARELRAGHAVVLISDARMPELGERLARAATVAGLPHGVVGLLHGATRELVTLCLSDAGAEEDGMLVASGTVERVVELRALCESQGFADPRLRALRCGVVEIDPERPPEESAAEVMERAFGRGTTFCGQLPGALGRVFCPARLFSRFTELCLAVLEASEVNRAPVPMIDGEIVARARAAWELGLDEGATCIAGGGEESTTSVLFPTILTNVEPFMGCARRQDPLPVLCLLRAG